MSHTCDTYYSRVTLGAPLSTHTWDATLVLQLGHHSRLTVGTHLSSHHSCVTTLVSTTNCRSTNSLKEQLRQAEERRLNRSTVSRTPDPQPEQEQQEDSQPSPELPPTDVPNLCHEIPKDEAETGPKPSPRKPASKTPTTV